MTVNQKMFAEIHELITEFPELHRQSAWETDPQETVDCGTTRCVAGWAVWLAAREHGLLSRKREFTDGTVRQELADLLGVTAQDIEDDWYLSEYGPTGYPVLGAKVLGLDGEQAYNLFHDFNNERVAARVKSYAETGADLPQE